MLYTFSLLPGDMSWCVFKRWLLLFWHARINKTVIVPFIKYWKIKKETENWLNTVPILGHTSNQILFQTLRVLTNQNKVLYILRNPAFTSLRFPYTPPWTSFKKIIHFVAIVPSLDLLWRGDKSSWSHELKAVKEESREPIRVKLFYADKMGTWSFFLIIGVRNVHVPFASGYC